MTIKSLVGIVTDTASRHITIRTEQGEMRIKLPSDTPMDDLLEQKRFVGYNATYTSNGSQYKLEFHKGFVNHILYGSAKE